MRYTYLGDRWTDPRLREAPCDPVRRDDGRCIVGGSKQLVAFTFPEALIAECQRLGSDATDIRDAAHEACHALDAEATDWGREAIHESLTRRVHRVDLVRAEIKARAVERLVCERMGVEYDSDKWLAIAAFETIKNGIAGLPFDFFPTAVGHAISSPGVAEMVDRVLALATEQHVVLRRRLRVMHHDAPADSDLGTSPQLSLPVG